MEEGRGVEEGEGSGVRGRWWKVGLWKGHEAGV